MSMGKTGMLVAGLSFLFLCYLYFPESIDDAYITLRYAKNLIAGNGLVFNVGEHVEGYSNFSWVMLLAGFGALGLPMAMVMKVLGFAAGAGTLFLVWKIAASSFKSEVAIIAPTLLLGLSSYFAAWSVDGLETMFYTFLLTLLIYLLARRQDNGYLIGLVAGVAALTRPEGSMYAIIAITWIALRGDGRNWLKVLWPVVVLAGGYEVFRYVYFDEFVSNTALAKVHPGLDRVAGGLLYFKSFIAGSGFLILLPMVAGLAGIRRSATMQLVIVFLFAQCVFLMVSGGDFMYGYRFLVPVMPGLALLCAQGIDVLCATRGKLAALTTLVLVALSLACAQYASLPAKHFGADNLTYRAAPHFGMADFLQQHTSSSDTVLLSEAGIIPYYINASVIDYLGLTSPYRVINNPDRSVNMAYLFSSRPKFVILSFVEDQQGNAVPRMPVEAEIQAYPEFQKNYRPVREFEVQRDASFLDDIYYHYSPQARVIYFTVFERSI